MLFFKSRDKLFHVKLSKWLVTSLTAFKIEFSLSSLKLLALLSVRMSDEDKLYLLRQALHICFLRSVINSLSIRILNELSLFIDSLAFNNVCSAPSANILWLRQPQAASNLPFFLGWLEEWHFVVCLPKKSLWGMINYSILNNYFSFSAGIKHRFKWRRC